MPGGDPRVAVQVEASNEPVKLARGGTSIEGGKQLSASTPDDPSGKLSVSVDLLTILI
jgi:hypothetical protein